MKDKLLDALWLALAIGFIALVAWAITQSTRADEFALAEAEMEGTPYTRTVALADTVLRVLRVETVTNAWEWGTQKYAVTLGAFKWGPYCETNTYYVYGFMAGTQEVVCGWAETKGGK